MIIIKMMGNLGNQMFIYAMGRSLALKYNDRLYIDLSGLKRYYYTANYKLDHFEISPDISYDIYRLPLLTRLKYSFTTTLFALEHLFYRKTRMDLVIPKNIIMKWFRRGCYYCTNRPYFNFPDNNPKKDKFVYGYFQGEQYFKEFKDQIRSELRVTVPISARDKRLIDEMHSCNSVGISIRACKAPENPKVNDNVILGYISKDYYYEGMRRISEKIKNPVFYVFADDIEKVKEEFVFQYPVIYVEPEDSVTGMRLLYNCKHFVIANSTFSWWGAYLSDYADKVIIMPIPWDRKGAPRDCIYIKDAIKIPCIFED